MQKRKSFFNNEMEQRFSLRKYTIGLCSVCLGFVVIGMGSQTVKADTVNGVEKSSTVQENKAQDVNSTNADVLTESKPNTLDSAAANPNTAPTKTKEDKTGSVDETASKTNSTSTGANANEATPTETKLDKANPAAANSNNALAQTKLTKTELVVQPKVSGTSTGTKPNEHGSDVVNPNAISTEVKLNTADLASLAKIKLQKMRLAKPVVTKALTESKVTTDNQFNFDDWTAQVDDTYLNITGYKGDRSNQIIVPNGADFFKAGKTDKNLKVEIDKDTLAGLIVDGVAPKLSNTDGQKIFAYGDWSDAFSGKNLHDISGLANLDTSGVSDMSGMFHDNQIRDLSPLANWNTGNVYYMKDMFSENSISDLSPLAKWNTRLVNNMCNMFYTNQIRDLSPLANWHTGNVFNMNTMFYDNQISDLSPLANWDTHNVTTMYRMFEDNQINDLSPLAKWNTRNVTDMNLMFEENQIRDLSPLANWNIGKVRDMSSMFQHNQISDLSPLANWNIGKVRDMNNMFEYNQIRDLSPLAHWDTSKVTNMDAMFDYNPLNPTINSQSTLNKFHASIYKFDNIGALASHSESKTFNDSSQISLDKNVVAAKDSATLTFKANSSAGNTYVIKIYNPNGADIQAATLPTALGTTDTSYQNGYTIITNKFINNGSVKQDISITRNIYEYHDWPAFAQYESTSGLITVTKGKEDLGSINITYQNVTNISNDISAPYIGDKPYINHTQNTFYFQPHINNGDPNEQYSFIKSAGLTITVPDDVTIDPDTFIDAKSGKTLKGAKIADNQYQVVLGNNTDGITVKGLINVPADKLTNGTVHLPGFGMKYTINTYNDKVAPLVATDTSKELSVIPDLASYHGDLIRINQSKWAFDRNDNHVYNYISQGFYNIFNGVPLELAVSTQVTNGVETFDMPAGVNITAFEPRINKDAIDHIDYIYTDGSKQTASSFKAMPKSIRQMKVYFKNGIQSDELFDQTSPNSSFDVSFDATYPDGSPIKNFDTFKVIGSFSCDELGSANNIDVAQVMLAPTQKLTDGMTTDTDQDESDKTPNASGNFIGATIRNDGLQHQGHLTNPIFYFKYNDLMVPDLSEISANYDNQNKNLGSIGLTNIDNNKIHSSIITDNTGQKFVKVQIDGEYYYVGSSDSKSSFNVKIPISNTPDALSATKDWSWYILNNNDKAKTESTIQNSSQGNKPLSVTVDGNTLSVGGTGTWQIIVAQGFTSGTETQGNLNGGPGLDSTQDDHQQDPTHFNIYDSIINATNDAKSDLVSVANLPSTQDGKSEFNVHMTGKASLINVMTGQTYDATITYSYGMGDNNFITGDQVTDWSKVKSIKVVPNGGAPSMTSLRLVVPVEDKTVYDDVGKTIYMSTITYGEDKANTKYTTKDGFAVPEKSTILPIIIKPGDAASAKLTVQGQATVHTLIHYKDANGKDVYVKLADQDKTYKELQDTMKRSDYLQSDRDLTIADRRLLPAGMVINYNDPTIRNSNNTYAADYANNVAAFDKTAKYDFDGDQVIFEGAMPEIVTKTHQAKETIHYVYRDGRTAAPDKVLTSITLKQTGTKNPFTGEITWNTPATDTLNGVNSPEITGYIADKLTVPSYIITMDSPDREVTVTYYDADNENADFTYFDDTKNSALKVVNKSGKSNTAIGYITTDDINNYEKQGYMLVSDDTNGLNLNFDSLPTVDQHYMIHLEHKTERVTRNDTVTRTIHYLYDNGDTAQPDKTQTVSFDEIGFKDDVIGKTIWFNDNAQSVDSVNTPSITGYTPDKSSIEGKSFKFGDKDVEVTVTYHANAQTAKITYIDDTTKNNLDSKDTSGKFGQAITFETAPADEIANYKKQGYKLVSNDFDSNKYQADNSKNVFHVHFVHGTKNVSRNDDVNMTVHYVMDDGSVAPSDNKQTVNFTENGIQDLVTQKITWTPADSQTLNDVTSPVLTGYTADIKTANGKAVNFGDNDINVTVTYHANAQTAKITYIDDTTKNNLDSKDTSGKFGQAIIFKTAPTDEIANYKKQGYKLVSNDFDDNKYQADNSKNVFHVHFIHDTKNVSRDSNVNMTVHYVMDDNSTAPSDNKQTVNFTENGIQDLVTQKITWTPAESQTFKDVATKSIVGYTPDKENVVGQTVNFGAKDINVTVHYIADKQTAKITYIDDTIKTDLDSKETSGKFGQAITFETAPADEIENYKKQGYVLVSSTFDNNKYQAVDSNNVFEVHFVHDTKKVSRNDDVNMTVHYVMDDDSEAPSDSKQTVNFTENGIQDLVTQKITWTPAESQTLKDVDSPVLTGYTADIKTANGKAVNFGDNDINVTVTYHANVQTAKITYIDDTTKNNLDSKDTSGKFGQAITFETAPADEIANYKKQGYKLVSNDFNDNKYQADNSKNVFYVHFVHDTKKVSREHSASFTVHYIYKDSRQAKPDHEQTLSFTENGSQDLVTQKITWTPADSQKFDDVVTSVITGYTPNHDKVIGQTATFETGDREVTVTYSPNVQIGHITYIDDNTGKTLTRDDFSGRTNEHEDYTSIDRIQEFENKGYEFVSSDYPDGGFNFDDNDQQDQIFNVHLKHGIVTVTTKNPQTPNTSINSDPHSPKYPKDIDNTNHDVKRTIDYTFKDGKTVQPTVNDSLHFERTVVIDKVTGAVLSDTWTPSQDFNDIQTPAVQGYTPDKAVISDKNIGHDHQDIVEHVVYSPDTQHMTITYIDDTTGETLHTDNPNGVSDQDTNYTTGNTIKKYEDQHYKLVSDSTNGQDLIFDHDDNADQTYEVHFIHNTHAIKQTTSPKQTIHYVYADGLARQGKVADDNVQQLSFKRDGYNDEVTGLDHWNAWTPANSNYNIVNSPVIQGYTPDKSVIEKSTVNPTDKDIEITVTYNANKQTAKITYIDDTTNTKLDSKDASGKFGQTITFVTTPADEIETYKKKGYVFVSNSFDNQTYQAVDSNNVFEVHLTHGNVTVTTKNPQTPDTSINPDPQSPKYPKDINNTNKDVKRTIDYMFKDGKTAQPTVNDSLHFERTVVIDKVTGAVSSDTWTQSQDFNDIQTPAVQGYTPDKTVVSDKNISHDHQDIVEHVVYSPNAQHMTITYIDDTTGETLHTDKPKGVSDQDANYTTGNTIKKYEEKHYKLVSDSTNGKDLIFDHDDNANQTYEVHFVHGTHTINQTTSPKQTIHYVYADGLARQGKAADDNVQQLSFKRDGYNDEVTGLDHWNAWTPANSNYNAVDSPVIQGYTPDKSVIEKSTVNPTDKDTEITVVYNANKQAARIIYVDKTTNTTLISKDLSGKSDEDSEYNTEDKIGQYKSQHYVLAEDETNGENVIFDHNDQQDQTYYVYLVHDTQKVNRQDTVTSTIDYKFEDGMTAQPTVTQTKHFSENGVKDLVTGKTTWTPVAPQKFDDIATKSIIGYTPDKDNVAGSTVKFGDQDVEVTVTYHNNAQTAKITYIDDTEKKTLGSDKQDGKFDHEITFEHDPAEVIKGLKEKGYKLVSDNFKPGIKYQSDNKLNTFEVHLVHTYEPVETSQTITETIHYIDANGKSVAPDHVATVTVKMTGTRDKVTNSITWNTPSTGHFDKVISPVVPNMTPDKRFIPSHDVRYGDSDITENVIYTLDEMPGELGKPNKPGDSTPKTPGNPNKLGDSTPKTPGKINKPGDSTPKTPGKSNKSGKKVSKTPKKPNKPGDSTPKTPRKPNKPGDLTPKTSEKTNKLSNEVSKHRGMIVKTTIPEKHVDSRTADNQASAKSTAKRELPQTGATINTGIWVGLASMIASLGLLGASKKRKKN